MPMFPCNHMVLWVSVFTQYFKNKAFCFSSRAAQSVQSQHLHRACVHCATSGCAISALICISIREPPSHPSIQICTPSRGLVPASVLICNRKAPVPCFQVDKAWYFHEIFPWQCGIISIGFCLFFPLWHLKFCFGSFNLPPGLHSSIC